MPAFVDNLNLNGGFLKTSDTNDSNLVIGIANSKQTQKNCFFNIENNSKCVEFQPNTVAKSPVVFDSFFYYAEYLNNETPTSYISATIGSEGQWLVNALGSFKIEKNEFFLILKPLEREQNLIQSFLNHAFGHSVQKLNKPPPCKRFFRTRQK